MKADTMKVLYLVLFAVLLASCKLGQNYERPQVAAPADFYTGISDGSQLDTLRQRTDTITYNSIPWRKFFKDSILISLIDTALVNNFEIKRAVRNIEIASQQFRQSKANFFPTLEAEPFRHLRQYYSDNYYSSPSANYYENSGTPPSSFYVNQIQNVSTLSSSWEIDIWGKFTRTREAQQAEFLESVEFRKAVQTALIAEIARNYYNLLMLNAQLKVAQENLILNDNTLEIIRLQFNSGETTALAIQQTEAQKLVAASLIPQIERDYAITENRLNVLLGRFPQEIEIDIALYTTNPHDVYSTGVPVELLRNRPDVIQAEQALRAANARVGIADALRYPSLNITGALGLNSMELSKILNPAGSGFGILAGSLLQPIFQNRRLRTNYNIAIQEKEIAEINFRERFLEAVNEVSNAMIMLTKLEEEYEIANQRIQVTQKGVRNASLLFRSGMANYLEIITAQSTALETELNLISIKMELLYADIELYRALGGGWQ